ncbi:MAG TPA: beta-ketoacyl-[acyl-carrier-protein] synthase family protein [Phycisphaerae bacterium]|jgi:3-oxoacyl-[acyl-carrier-protein] synthase II
MKRRVVITGLGVATPIGIGIDPVWEGLLSKRCGLKRIAAFDASGLASGVGGEIPAFKMTDYVPKSYRKSVKVMSRDIEIALLCAYEAVRNAGLKTKCLIERGEAEGAPNLDSTRFGANIGAGLICADLNELAGALATAQDPAGQFSLVRWGREGMENLTPLWLLKFLPNMLACHVTIVHDAQAPSNTITCGEASSHLAIGEAFRTIARGAADVCICGGAESKMNPMGVARQQLLGRMAARHGGDGARACRPFSADRDGIVASEGGGLVILEVLEHAQARGARIYAELVGFGATANTHGWRQPDPQGQGIANAIRAALKDGECAPEQIGLIGAFGAGTKDHDASEAAAWRSVFGDQLSKVPALAIKGSIGNNGAGSGAIEFAVLTMALHHKTVPPSLNTAPSDPKCGLRFVQDDPIDARVSAAVSVAYALGGGQNAALVIKRFPL